MLKFGLHVVYGLALKKNRGFGIVMFLVSYIYPIEFSKGLKDATETKS